MNSDISIALLDYDNFDVFTDCGDYKLLTEVVSMEEPEEMEMEL